MAINYTVGELNYSITQGLKPLAMPLASVRCTNVDISHHMPRKSRYRMLEIADYAGTFCRSKIFLKVETFPAAHVLPVQPACRLDWKFLTLGNQ
jgi:hypothetical protein